MSLPCPPPSIVSDFKAGTCSNAGSIPCSLLLNSKAATLPLPLAWVSSSWDQFVTGRHGRNQSRKNRIKQNHFPLKRRRKNHDYRSFFVQLYHISLTPKNMTFWPNWYQLPFWKALLNQLMRPFTSSFKNSVVFRFCLDINRRSQEQRRIWFVYNSLCSYFTLITCHWTLF